MRRFIILVAALAVGAIGWKIYRDRRSAGVIDLDSLPSEIDLTDTVEGAVEPVDTTIPS